MTDIPNLWPDDVGKGERMLTPFAILKHQAAGLAERTDGELEGEVQRRVDEDGDLFFSFKILARGLNYAYELFVAWHNPILLYPVSCRFSGQGSVKCDDQAQLVEWLRSTLSSTETMRVVSSLRAQLRE